ncbi:hypothetical protein ACIGFK_04210 [Streptomyces sp. NPDC085524]|uniref:hypothetical protein n=1 Tax=Streptomyces sp. NPDC085524 TaxID=3365728 RepID=UPI0037D4F763
MADLGPLATVLADVSGAPAEGFRDHEVEPPPPPATHAAIHLPGDPASSCLLLAVLLAATVRVDGPTLTERIARGE